MLTGEWSIVADYEFVDLGSANAQREPFRFSFVARVNFFDSGQRTLHGVTTSSANQQLRSLQLFGASIPEGIILDGG